MPIWENAVRDKVVVVTMIESPSERDISRIAEALGVEFSQRDSMYWGGVYYLANGTGGEKVYFFRNHDLIDDAPAFPQAPQGRWLLRFDATERDPEQIREALSANLGDVMLLLTA